jgi:predicted DNA-binding protein
MNEKMLSIRASENELEILARYAAETRRTKSDIVREFLRSLERRMEKSAAARATSRKPTTPKKSRP